MRTGNGLDEQVSLDKEKKQKNGKKNMTNFVTCIRVLRNLAGKFGIKVSYIGWADLESI